jgi:hypothetical protein
MCLTEDSRLSKASGRLGRKGRQTLYTILAGLLCFVGPTYFLAGAARLVPHIYATALGLLSLLVGVVFVLRLVEE